MGLLYDSAGRLFIAGFTPEHRLDMLGEQQLITEIDANNNVLRRYVHGPETDEPLVWYEGSSASDRRFFHADERGSIIALSDNNGAVIHINSYDDYGRPGSSAGAGTLYGRFGYTGQAWLAEIGPSTGSGQGLHYYRARIYNQQLGRFMQTDPVGYEGGINLYEYAESDPVNATDPDGTQRRFGWIVELLDSGRRRMRALSDQRQAVEARRRGENVEVSGGRRAARQVERAAAENPNDVMRHSGHRLRDGSRGDSHYQTDGVRGHTFYDVAAAVLGGLVAVAETLDRLTNPLNDSGITPCQTRGRCDENGHPYTSEELAERRAEERRNRENQVQARPR